MKTPRRVVVTGMGAVTPVGNSVDEAWRSVLAGKSGIGPIDTMDVSGFTTRFGGLVKNFETERYLGPKDARKMDPFMQYGFAAGLDAFADSGLEVTEAMADRYGALVGAGIGGLSVIETGYDVYRSTGSARRMSPFVVPGCIINMISGHLSINLGLKGPNLAVVTACTTSTHALGLAARLIAWDEADAMLAGGAEHSSTPTGLGGFCSARALSQRNDDPEHASRPWDRDRDGFVLADGATVFMLEEYEHARKRGAKIYAELIGFGMSGDAHHMTAPPEDGDGARRAMKHAIDDAGLNPSDIGYINAHATSTKLGDLAETTAIKNLFGADAPKIPVSSTKSMTGHLLGAAGAIEAMFSVLALRDQVLPPTINIENPDEGCDLDYVPGSAREVKGLKYAMSNSFGFGGTNGTLIFANAP
ncbi:MAG TPA: beta-ketoacyl-ACP synthase II [Gammaproteobacteria bacterium]|nr:beta-ketoacyl-ACP synthase II [Gammaproteobacteria bacterium]